MFRELYKYLNFTKLLQKQKCIKTFPVEKKAAFQKSFKHSSRLERLKCRRRILWETVWPHFKNFSFAKIDVEKKRFLNTNEIFCKMSEKTRVKSSLCHSLHYGLSLYMFLSTSVEPFDHEKKKKKNTKLLFLSY